MWVLQKHVPVFYDRKIWGHNKFTEAFSVGFDPVNERIPYILYIETVYETKIWYHSLFVSIVANHVLTTVKSLI